jgi:hypothetical protein
VSDGNVVHFTILCKTQGYPAYRQNATKNPQSFNAEAERMSKADAEKAKAQG